MTSLFGLEANRADANKLLLSTSFSDTEDAVFQENPIEQELEDLDLDGHPIYHTEDNYDYPDTEKKFGEVVVVMKHIRKGKVPTQIETHANQSESNRAISLASNSPKPLFPNLVHHAIDFFYASHQTEYHLEGRQEKVCALQNIHLYPGNEYYPIRRGEFVMLRGPSGGGKTTLLNILGTIDLPTSGTVEILGQPVNDSSSDTYLSLLRLERIGFVFQTFNLLATLSALEAVELPMIVAGKLSHNEITKRAKELLTLVGLRDRMGHLPSELSGGEQQRVTIARALANDPELLLLDEPTGDLDTKNTIEIMDLLLDINIKRKTTCVMVSHNPDVECYADRILYLEDGQFCKQVLNVRQTPLIYDSYIAYVNKQKTQLEEGK